VLRLAVPGGAAKALAEAFWRRVGSRCPAGQGQSRNAAGVRSRHRGADVGPDSEVVEVRAEPVREAVEADLADRLRVVFAPPPCDSRLGRAAPRREEVESLPEVRVGSEASALSARADGQDAGSARGEQRAGTASATGRIAGRGDHESTVLLRLARRSTDGLDLLATTHSARQLEADVDHVGVVAGRPEDAGGDVDGVAGPLRVEHPYGHELRAVGEPGEEVVGHLSPKGHLLGDRPRDVCAMAVFV
jgi:hypothetical protein